MSSLGACWRPSSVAVADDKDCGTARSILDVFADMLNINEDIFIAAAECQAEGDVQGLIAYQRILHRDLIEMAEFVDSMFGVYSNINVTSSTKKRDESEPHTVAAEELGTTFQKLPIKTKAQRGALFAAIEAEEKTRETQRSKEQWIKSRHQVLEEESVSAIFRKNINSILGIANAQFGEQEAQQGSGGLALANQLRAHQNVATLLKASKDTPETRSSTPMNLLLASQLAMLTANPPLAVPSKLLPPMATSCTAQKPIMPNRVENEVSKIALPPASQSSFNMLSTFPGYQSLVFNPQATAGFMMVPPWQPQMQTAIPARAAMSTRPIAKTPEFKRMCESCRKRHFSVRQCRFVLQHKDPEWQPAELPAAKRRRKRKPKANIKQVT